MTPQGVFDFRKLAAKTAAVFTGTPPSELYVGYAEKLPVGAATYTKYPNLAITIRTEEEFNLGVFTSYTSAFFGPRDGIMFDVIKVNLQTGDVWMCRPDEDGYMTDGYSGKLWAVSQMLKAVSVYEIAADKG